MYAVRILIGGDIMIVRVTDNQRTRYTGDYLPNGENTLDLLPYQVKYLVETAQSEWVEKYIR